MGGMLSLALAILAAQVQTQAQTQVPVQPQPVRWEVGDGDPEDYCYFAKRETNPGATIFMIVLQPDGRHLLRLANNNWTARLGQSYQIGVSTNGRTYRDVTARGHSNASVAGFEFAMPSGLIEEIVAAREIDFRFTHSGQRIDIVPLAGSSDAFLEAKACLGPLRQRIGERQREAQRREQERLATIPRDPFANQNSAGTLIPIRRRPDQALTADIIQGRDETLVAPSPSDAPVEQRPSVRSPHPGQPLGSMGSSVAPPTTAPPERS